MFRSTRGPGTGGRRRSLRAAQATAEFWNEHRGGVGGRPIEVVTCETGGEPAGATDCANRMVEEGVVAGETLDGMYLTASVALGAADDPTYQLYQAVMGAYGEAVADVDNVTAMGGYTAMASLATALQDLTGEATPESAIAAIRAMPESAVPGGGGVRFRCDGEAVASQPPVCTSQWLRTQLDASGEVTTFEPVDSTDLLAS